MPIGREPDVVGLRYATRRNTGPSASVASGGVRSPTIGVRKPLGRSRRPVVRQTRGAHDGTDQGAKRIMKGILTLAACCLTAVLVACQSDSSSNTPMAAGAVSGEKSSCAESKACCKDGASMGAVNGEKSGCCKSGEGASMGAVNGEKSG